MSPARHGRAKILKNKKGANMGTLLFDFDILSRRRTCARPPTSCRRTRCSTMPGRCIATEPRREPRRKRLQTGRRRRSGRKECVSWCYSSSACGSRSGRSMERRITIQCPRTNITNSKIFLQKMKQLECGPNTGLRQLRRHCWRSWQCSLSTSAGVVSVFAIICCSCHKHPARHD